MTSYVTNSNAKKKAIKFIIFKIKFIIIILKYVSTFRPIFIIIFTNLFTIKIIVIVTFITIIIKEFTTNYHYLYLFNFVNQ